MNSNLDGTITFISANSFWSTFSKELFLIPANDLRIHSEAQTTAEASTLVRACLQLLSQDKKKKREKMQTEYLALRCFAHWQSGRPPHGLKCQASCHSHIPAHLCLPVISAIGNRLRHPQRPSASLHQLTRVARFLHVIGDVTFNDSSNSETSRAINLKTGKPCRVFGWGSVCSQWRAVWGNTVQNEAQTSWLIGFVSFFFVLFF